MEIRVNGFPHKQGVSKPNRSRDEALAKSLSDFEAVFLTLLWRDMAKSAGMGLGAWDVFLSQSMGKTWANAGGIGLAKVLYNQMSNSSPRDSSGDDGDENERPTGNPR